MTDEEFDTSKPFFEHDCTRCTFISGLFDIENCQTVRYDLYICYQPSRWDSIILRYGHEGAMYMSYDIGSLLLCMGHRPVLQKAFNDHLRSLITLKKPKDK